eukprot:10952143-Alexandrium_andersonii.AAC.1
MFQPGNDLELHAYMPGQQCWAVLRWALAQHWLDACGISAQSSATTLQQRAPANLDEVRPET